MYEACQKLDATVLEQSEEYEDVRSEVQQILDKHPVVFFKLSSVSCKDVATDDFGPAYKINSLSRLFRSIVYSFRIMSEIEAELAETARKKDDYCLAFTPWRYDIDPQTEIRLLVVEGVLEAAIRPATGALVMGSEFETLETYVSKFSDLFPEKTLAIDVYLVAKEEPIEFVEFNPLDEELDTFQADLSGCSALLLATLKREAVPHWLLD
jgi:hypothetical protein